MACTRRGVAIKCIDETYQFGPVKERVKMKGRVEEEEVKRGEDPINMQYKAVGIVDGLGRGLYG